jgi:hypothetical protein
MDKSSILKAYNTLFFEFLDDIITIYPTKEIKYARETFELLKKANPTIIIKYWYKDVYLKYSEQIENRDVTFFIEKDYANDLRTNEQNLQKVLEMIEITRKTIYNMDQTNKDHCADYILNLSKLSKVYNDLTK